MEQTLKRNEYETWDSAFQGLAPAVRQQSVRVASYTRVLFVEACDAGFGQQTPGGAERIVGKNADLAYKCGLYHQLGKALVPPEYQIWQNDFTEEEQAVYKKYTTDGRQLVASLQERAARSRFKKGKKDGESPTDNVLWLMLRESCEQHMERFNGSGYPKGLWGDEISPIAQIVGLAKELDRLCSETKSENPFSEAFDRLTGEAGKLFSEPLIEILKACKAKCRAVYTKFIHYTLTLPKTIPLVEKRKDRPFGLRYRPVINGEAGKVNAYEADMWFTEEDLADIEQTLKRTELLTDLSFYFLYEAADTLLRIQNCKLQLDYLVLKMFPSIYKEGSLLQRFNQLFKDQPIDKSRLLLTIPQDIVLEANKTTLETIQRYLKNGICLLLDGWNPATLAVEKVKEIGFKYVRPITDIYMKTETAPLLSGLPKQGINVIAGGVDSNELLVWLCACGVQHLTGAICGDVVDEDGLIRDALLSER